MDFVRSIKEGTVKRFCDLLERHGCRDLVIDAWELDISSLDSEDASALKRIMHENHLFVPNTKEDAEKFENDHDVNISPRFVRDESGRIVAIFISQSNISGTVDMSGFTCLRHLCITPNGGSHKNEDQRAIKLDVRRNIALRTLICWECGLESLDVSHNPELEELSCAGNKLTGIDLSFNSKLRSIICSRNSITKLDFSNNPELRYLTCSFNNLSSLDVSHNPVLTDLSCEWDDLKHLDVSHNADLRNLRCGGNKLTNLDLSFNEKLEFLSCGQEALFDVFNDRKIFDHTERIELIKDPRTDYMNCIEHIDLSKNLMLKQIECSAVALRSIDVSHLTKLESLTCDNNQLTNIDVSHNLALEHLDCDYNQLTYLDVSNNVELKQLYCGNNRLTNIDLSHNKQLQALDLGNMMVFPDGIGNHMTEIDVSDNIELRSLHCKAVGLKTLDVSHNPKLETLVCSRNELTKLNVENNTALKQLVCGNADDPKGKNRFGTLYLAKNPELVHLSCTNCGLRVLDISENPKLAFLECYGNDLKDVDTSHNPELKPENCHIKKPAAELGETAKTVGRTIARGIFLGKKLADGVGNMADGAISTISGMFSRKK